MASKNKTQVEKNQTFWCSFIHSIDGIHDLYSQEHNFRFHLYLSAAIFILALYLKASPLRLAFVVFFMFLTLSTEIINSLIERLADLKIGHHFNVYIKEIKDIAAGWVTITALFAGAIDLILLLPLLINKIATLF